MTIREPPLRMTLGEGTPQNDIKGYAPQNDRQGVSFRTAILSFRTP